mgnify:CR=1 FL=1
MNFNRAERIVWLEFNTVEEAKEFSRAFNNVQRSPKHLNEESKKREGLKK